MTTRPRRVAVVAYDGAQTLDIVGPLEVFGSVERMRRTFQRHLHVVPHDYRQRFIVDPSRGTVRR